MNLNMRLSPAKRLANKRKHLASNYPSGNVWSNYVSDQPDYGKQDNGARLVWFNGIKELSNTWRFTGYADEIIRLNHKGWFADQYQDETLRGIVGQLPARGGEAIYIAGYVSSDSDGICFELTTLRDTYATKEDAARAADSIAENAAEESREYRIKETAENDIAELRAEIKLIREDNKALLRSLAKNRSEVRAKLRRIEALEENPYLIAE